MTLINNGRKSFYSLNEDGYVQEIGSLSHANKWKKTIVKATQTLGQAHKNKKILFLYRGEDREMFVKKTGSVSDSDEALRYDRFFVIGSKAKSYYKQKQKRYRTIKQFAHKDKASYIFDHLHTLSKSSSFQSVLSHFDDASNKNSFIEKLTKIRKKNHQITIANFYLAFIHTISSDQIDMNAHSVLLSSTRNPDTAQSFSRNGFVIGFWLEQPITSQAIDYGSIDMYNDILDRYSFPTIDVIHFPDEKEVTVFSGIFPHNIYFVYDVCKKRHVFNPYLLDTDISVITDTGIKVDQQYFFKRIENIYSSSIWRRNSELMEEL